MNKKTWRILTVIVVVLVIAIISVLWLLGIIGPNTIDVLEGSIESNYNDTGSYDVDVKVLYNASGEKVFWTCFPRDADRA